MENDSEILKVSVKKEKFEIAFIRDAIQGGEDENIKTSTLAKHLIIPIIYIYVFGSLANENVCNEGSIYKIKGIVIDQCISYQKIYVNKEQCYELLEKIITISQEELRKDS